MLIQMIEMCSNLPALVDDYPVPGKYEPIKNIYRHIQMIINYYESKFWPEDIEFEYDLRNFGISED